MTNNSINIPKPFKLELLIPPSPRRRKPSKEEYVHKNQGDLFGGKKLNRFEIKKRKNVKSKVHSASQVDMFSGQVVNGRDIQVDVEEILEVKKVKVIPKIDSVNNFIVKVDGQVHEFETEAEANRFQLEWDKLKKEFEEELIYEEYENEIFEADDENLTDEVATNNSPIKSEVIEVRNSDLQRVSNDEQVVNKYKHDEYSLESIAQDVPCLTPAQKEDVLKAEQVLCKQNRKGMMFTNGTGTGKTYVGLGIIKRFELRGKNKVLIVVPTDTKAKDWIEDAKDVNLKINQLQSIQDAGEGIVITTYANLRQNEELLKRDFELLVYDESHKLNSNLSGRITEVQNKHQQLAKIPSVAENLVYANLPEVFQDYRDRETEVEKQKYIFEKSKEIYDSVKVVFLSATPFSYHKTLSYADGILFFISESDLRKSLHENSSGNKDFFLKKENLLLL